MGYLKSTIINASKFIEIKPNEKDKDKEDKDNQMVHSIGPDMVDELSNTDMYINEVEKKLRAEIRARLQLLIMKNLYVENKKYEINFDKFQFKIKKNH